MFAGPLSGFRHAAVWPHRTQEDWPFGVVALIDTRYANCDWVPLVCDNLNTHPIGAFYEAFESACARHVRRIDFCYHTQTQKLAQCR